MRFHPLSCFPLPLAKLTLREAGDDKLLVAAYAASDLRGNFHPGRTKWQV
jgi:hypothetical protein